MNDRISPPRAATALLLLCLLPVQAGFSGALGASAGPAHGPVDASGSGAGAIGDTGAGAAHAGMDHHARVDHGRVDGSHPVDAAAADPLDDHHHMPCSEEGLCDTGLMSCSSSSCVALFFSPAGLSTPAVVTAAAAERPSADARPGGFDALRPTPPPRR